MIVFRKMHPVHEVRMCCEHPQRNKTMTSMDQDYTCADQRKGSNEGQRGHADTLPATSLTEKEMRYLLVVLTEQRIEIETRKACILGAQQKGTPSQKAAVCVVLRSADIPHPQKGRWQLELMWTTQTQEPLIKALCLNHAVHLVTTAMSDYLTRWRKWRVHPLAFFGQNCLWKLQLQARQKRWSSFVQQR